MTTDFDQNDGQSIGARQKAARALKHYHGDKVRELFFAIGIIMILGLPLFSNEINVGGFVAVFGILIVNFFGGMTSPHRKFVIFYDLIISIIGTGLFELTAFYRYQSFGNFFDGYFWFNEIIALLFFSALYFSTKTFRKISLEMDDEQND